MVSTVLVSAASKGSAQRIDDSDADAMQARSNRIKPNAPNNALERFLQRKSYTARYPKWLKGRPLLVLTSLFGSLGDALFGYDQGNYDYTTVVHHASNGL